jgi:uncharacterized protein
MVPRLKKPRTYTCPLRSRYGQLFELAGPSKGELEITVLSPDEMEALFLCYDQDLDQQAAGEKMGISRSSVQRLLVAGRKKMVDALVNNRGLAIAPIYEHRYRESREI